MLRFIVTIGSYLQACTQVPLLYLFCCLSVCVAHCYSCTICVIFLCSQFGFEAEHELRMSSSSGSDSFSDSSSDSDDDISGSDIQELTTRTQDTPTEDTVVDGSHLDAFGSSDALDDLWAEVERSPSSCDGSAVAPTATGLVLCPVCSTDLVDDYPHAAEN